jgi:hypothetical protein
MIIITTVLISDLGGDIEGSVDERRILWTCIVLLRIPRYYCYVVYDCIRHRYLLHITVHCLLSSFRSLQPIFRVCVCKEIKMYSLYCLNFSFSCELCLDHLTPRSFGALEKHGSKRESSYNC